MFSSQSDRLEHIRSHLEKKSKAELITLLLDLIREMDEPTRQRFWTHLAPPGVATADLRYPSPGDFLAKLEEFSEAVEEGEYFDEEAAEYYGDDSDYQYYHDQDYDPADHAGLKALQNFLAEADSYFQAGRYDVAVEAYEHLLGIALGEPYETLGVDFPLTYLSQNELVLVERYFVALRESQPQARFFTRALNFLARNDQPYRHHLDNFLALVGLQAQPALRAFLERWADDLERAHIPTPASGLPFHMRLLLRLYTEANQPDAERALWIRFRRQHPSLYVPLLADRETAEDWQALLAYGHEALDLAESPRPPHYLRGEWPMPDQLTVRGQLARAYAATGEPVKAFDLYRPAFDAAPSFATYAEARRLALAIGPELAKAFTKEVIAKLNQQGAAQRYLLCQIYLSEENFDQTYTLVSGLTAYQGMEESKLVAKAHLLAALGPQPDPRMGPNLQDLYTKIEKGEKEPTRFLRDAHPLPAGLSRQTALSRTEQIYRRLMQAHIDNGRKTYATAAYYCALLGEIAAHEGHLPAFVDWYDDFMEAYKRFRALRAEMDTKVGPLLRNQRS